MKRISSILMASAVLAVLLLPAAASAQYPPSGETLTVEDSTVAAGGRFTIGGGGFRAGSTVTIRIGSTVLGTATADSSGRFTFTGTLPRNTGAGTVTILAVGVDPSGAARSLSTALTVLPLGATGSNTSTMLFIAMGLIILGGAALAFSRRDAVRA